MQQDHFESKRQAMVESQLKQRGILDNEVLTVMSRIERHLFVKEEDIQWAYQDFPLPIDCEQTISQPYIVALMTSALRIKPWEKVLEIGTGSGYQSAILAELAHEVYTIERIKVLQTQAESRLRFLGYTNIYYKVGNGVLGWATHGAYDAILVAAAARVIPKPLIEQLRLGGRMVIPIGSLASQTLLLITKTETGIQKEILCECRFVPLINHL